MALNPLTTNMKVFAFDVREYDELGFFAQYTKELGMECDCTSQILRPETVDLAAGYEYVSVFTTPITAPMLDRFKEIGVKMIGTRCIGFDHIDLVHAKEIGMVVTNITYDSDGVAEFNVMEILMAVRRIKEVMKKSMGNDFRLNCLLSRQLKDLSVGVMGAGKIGLAVLKDLSSFGCKLYYCNRRRKEEADRYAEYVSTEELIRTCDVISLNMELNDETHHILDAEAFSKMKDDVVIVNTGRGALIDSQALIDALNSGKVSCAALDVVENELGLTYNDCRDKDLTGQYIDIFRNMPNVIYTQHMAFYYHKAVSDMVYNCLLSMKMHNEGKEIPHRLA